MRFRTAAIAAAAIFAVGLAAVYTANAGNHRPGDGRGGRGYMHDRHGGWGGHHGHMGHHLAQFFDLFDIDADNVVTRAEALRPATQRFARLDGDGDGRVSTAEIDAGIAAEPGRFDRELLEGLDADGDASVSPAEFAVRTRAVFAWFDANDDGRVTFTEFNALRQARFDRGMTEEDPGEAEATPETGAQ